MDKEDGVPETVDEDYLRDRNPVFHRGLLQLTMGAPQQIYYGGLVMAQLRHFDPERERPGLPRGVSALVEDVSSTGVTFTLVNDAGGKREVIVQAGAYAEHEFQTVEHGDRTVAVDGPVLTVTLPSGTRASVTATMERFVNDPTYTLPWSETRSE
jgi:hypothetical protein